MIAELKVYENPSSLEPSKTYTVYRMTPHTWGAVQDFIFKRFSKEELQKDDADFEEIASQKYKTYSDEEIQQEMVRFLRILFPEITDEEIWMLDYGDGSGTSGQFYEFCNQLIAYGNSESSRSLKN